MSTVVKDLGAVSAYAYAVEKGYTGTEAEFAELMADYAEVGQRAENAAGSALESKTAAQTAATTATNKASEAATSAQTATTKAGEAQTSAQTASNKASEASQSASQASGYAQTAETAKTAAQTAKTQAETARDNAVTAKTAAETAQGKAETAQAAAETAQGAAEDAAESVSASAAQIATNTAEITELKNDGVAPSAEQLLSKNTTADAVPYLFRQTGGNGADREYMDVIVGGTVAWNQFAHDIEGKTAKGVTMTVNDDGSVTLNGTASETYTFIIILVSEGTGTLVSNHVYYIKSCPKATGAGTDFYGGIAGLRIDIDGNGGLYKHTNSFTSTNMRIDFNAGAAFNNATFYPQYIDLTQALTPTIADHIYSLEQTTAGAGVAFFKSLFPNDYYEYNAGELKSVEGVSAHETVGFNQWDEEWENGRFNTTTGNKSSGNGLANKNKIKVFPNTRYNVTCGTDYGTTLVLFYYDADENFLSYAVRYSFPTSFTTPSNAHYVNFNLQTASAITTYNHDICINLFDPTKNGTYEPYKAHSYPLDSSLTLRGIPKLSDGKMYFDGDRYLPDGKVERRYGIRAYQSGDESLADAITDGTNTVYKLTATNIEEATPYRQLQICDPNGTEEFVSTGIVPVGHETRYPENLRAKIDGLPWDFSSLIAPTEKTTTASRNYTTGSLLIMGNTLYKVTANIANGGTITPNTNVTATTLSEILSALAQ